MREDIRLFWKFRNGNEEALCRIYEKYSQDMLGLAYALLNDKTVAEDVVHDVFVSFAESAGRGKGVVNLRSYLLTSVANRLRNMQRTKPLAAISEEMAETYSCEILRPEEAVMTQEKSELIRKAIAQLPAEQQEVIAMHIQGRLKFKEIAKVQGVSLPTVQSRYLYGLRKLKSLLNGEIEK